MVTPLNNNTSIDSGATAQDQNHNLVVGFAISSAICFALGILFSANIGQTLRPAAPTITSSPDNRGAEADEDTGGDPTSRVRSGKDPVSPLSAADQGTGDAKEALSPVAAPNAQHNRFVHWARSNVLPIMVYLCAIAQALTSLIIAIRG